MAGGAWTEALAARFKEVKRSCERGLGESRQADAVPMGSGTAAGTYRGKWLCMAEQALLAGVWWMLREIEMANLVKADVEISTGAGCSVAALKISASKTDWRAKGIIRKHGCACPSAWCPVKAVRALTEAASQKMRDVAWAERRVS